MRFIRPIDLVGIERCSPFRWRKLQDDGAFVIEPPRGVRDFLGLVCRVEGERVTLQIAFDRGHGFDEASALLFKMYPFGFYHLPPAALVEVRRIRIRIEGERGDFTCAIVETERPLPVAAMHFLFNLRYQNVKALTAAGTGRHGSLALARDNVRRISRFFRDVAGGDTLRSQQDERDILHRIVAVQTIAAAPLRVAMREAQPAGPPLISFVSPAYETKPAYIADLVGSFVAEEAPYAELILVDDGSVTPETLAALAEAATRPTVRVVTMAANGGIAAATNAGIAAARGDWLSFIDHDDAFASGAIPVIARAIAEHPAAQLFYTDELITDAGLTVTGAFCKPAFDPVLLSGVNYINHLSVFRRERVAAIGGLARERDGSQDYDLLLRYLAGVSEDAVIHIPFLAYRWRRGEETYSTVHRDRSVNNARLALAAAYGDAAAGVEPATLLADLHRVRFRPAPPPRVSVVIPNRDSLDLMRRVSRDLRERTDYPDIEIVVPDNGTTDPAVLAFYEAERETWGGERFRAAIVTEPFNFSAMCNRGARLARGEVILFLNNDIEVTGPEWLAEMVECLSYPSTGIVGAKLLYPGGRLQHAGVIVGLGEAAGHWFVNDPADDVGPMGRLAVRQTLSAVTGACMLVTKTCFEAIGGFDETMFPIAYNDIDLCLRARSAGFRTVWTPFATLIHHESASRGSDETGENRQRLMDDISKLQDRHGTRTLIDGAYSPFYDRRYSRPNLIVPPGLPAARPAVFS